MVLLGTKSIKRIKLFSLVLAALCVLVLCACTSNESMLMGKWRGKLLVGSGDFYMAFNSDGSYIESTDKGIKNQGTWSLSKSTITVLGSDGVVLTYTIEELKKDKLILVAPIFNMKFQMEKVEDGNTSASNNIPINPIIGAIIAIALLAIIILFVSKKKKNNKISHSVKPSGKSFCGNCGTKLEDGVRFCPNCGKNLSEPIAADNVKQSVEYGEEEENPIKKYLPYILGAIALIAICGGGWWYFNSSKAPQSNNEAAVAEAVEADTIVTEADVDDVATNTIQDNGVERPSVQKLGNLFNEMETGKLTALKDYGFTLKDKQKKMILSDYAEEGDEADIELIKEVYSLKYKMGNPSEMSDGFMKIIYVYAKEYGEPSMEIECDEKTWNELKFEAESSLKNSMGNSYILNMNSYINFIHEGAITVSTENSITWE